MSSRERILAISVGGTVALLVALWGWSKIDAMYTFRRAEIGNLGDALPVRGIEHGKSLSGVGRDPRAVHECVLLQKCGVFELHHVTS